MASNFASLRANRQSAFAKLNEELQKNSQSGTDERFWKLTIDPKTKLGYAQIRFLPNAPNEDVTWVKYYSHGFKVGGNWFIENCPTSLGQVTCPVCKENGKLWNTGVEADRKTASARKRKLSYISNILVINDSAHPENNGKTFLFKYGPKIFEKIQEYINPKFPDAEPGNPFDFWSGSDFKLKSHAQGDFVSYEKSEFVGESELFPGDEAKKEEIWNGLYPLTPFVAADKFKPYEEIESRFIKVLTDMTDKPSTAQPTTTTAPATATAAATATAPVVTPTAEKKAAAPRKRPAAPTKPESTDTDDLTSFFEGILAEDE